MLELSRLSTEPVAVLVVKANVPFDELILLDVEFALTEEDDEPTVWTAGEWDERRAVFDMPGDRPKGTYALWMRIQDGAQFIVKRTGLVELT